MENSSSFGNTDNREMPKNHMALAIVGTILGLCPTLCCINAVLGGIAIYFATQVKKKFETGDYAGAESASKNAKILAYVSLGLFVASVIYSVITFDMEAYNEVIEKFQEAMNQ
ncbi:MAG: CD225/dispanin family protein [Flavobacteriaceae bacterium]|nr:CD225/dispanin family protein [Flavobacteriaceae bacterium]